MEPIVKCYFTELYKVIKCCLTEDRLLTHSMVIMNRLTEAPHSRLCFVLVFHTHPTNPAGFTRRCPLPLRWKLESQITPGPSRKLRTFWNQNESLPRRAWLTRRFHLVTLCCDYAQHGDPENAKPIQPHDCFDCERHDRRPVLFGRHPDDWPGDTDTAYSRRTPQLEWHLAGDDDCELGPAGPRDASCRGTARRVPGRPGAGRPGPGTGLGRRRAARTWRRRRQR